MKRDLHRRLAQAEISATATKWADLQVAHHRELLRSCVRWHQTIRERLLAMGIDPVLAVALRRGEGAAAELAAIPDTDELSAADKAMLRAHHRNGDEGARQFRAKIKQMAKLYLSRSFRLTERASY